MIRICVAKHSTGRWSVSTALEIAFNEGLEIYNKRLTDICPIEDTWQYEEKDRALVDILEIFEEAVS